MKLTVDANILFACLIKDGTARKLWFKAELELYSPQFIIQEFLKYQKVLEKKNWKK